MDNLLRHIDKFYKSNKPLKARMEDLAKVFLFGGYIKVRDEYRIYLRTVEFYYHEEDGKEKDPIMYHRNNYLVDGEIPYFKPLSFNSHDTGVDITFENEEKHIRASVLIRAYEVLDVKSDERMVWNPAAQQFQPYKEGLGLPKYNKQSMYVKKFLNGFTYSRTPNITWVSVEHKGVISEKDITPKVRQGVYKYEREPYAPGRWNKITPLRREEKKWAFKREIEIG